MRQSRPLRLRLGLPLEHMPCPRSLRGCLLLCCQLKENVTIGAHAGSTSAAAELASERSMCFFLARNMSKLSWQGTPHDGPIAPHHKQAVAAGGITGCFQCTSAQASCCGRGDLRTVSMHLTISKLLRQGGDQDGFNAPQHKQAVAAGRT